MSEIGAQAAFKGYRLQALYTLYRILYSGEGVVFHLEGQEDLDIYDTANKVVEIIQLKAYDRDLTLSVLDPSEERSFFRRVLERQRNLKDVSERIVSFGPYGQEMSEAWKGEAKARQSAITKFLKWGYNRAQAEYFLSEIQLERVDEGYLRASVFEWLQASLTGYDPQAAFDLLHSWLYQASEAKARVTKQDVLEKVAAVGRFLAERAAHHAEWFTSIVPLSDEEFRQDKDYQEEFYQGTAAQYGHILANVDVARDERLQTIDRAFARSAMVVVRGASGQGKSALAYRYLHDFVPSMWRFEIRLIQDRRHALSVARALLGHLDAIGAPAYIFIDVAPGETAWTELVRELQKFPNARVLVTIREEDWLRASIDRALLKFEEIELRLDEAEAEHIFERLSAHRTPLNVLDFEEVWERFGRGGPLLEFTYLVTQHDTLQVRLRAQVERLEEEVRSGTRPANELELLRRVAVASAYGARLKLRDLVQSLQLAAPQRAIASLEREYLLRLDNRGQFVDGLHPLRSLVLMRFLTDDLFDPWGEVAARSLPMMVETDIENFLLYAFSRHKTDTEQVLAALFEWKPQTFEGAGNALQALLWLGIAKYIELNHEVIQEAKSFFKAGWSAVVFADVGGVSAIAPELGKPFYEGLDFMPQENKDHMASFRNRLTPIDTVYNYAKRWLNHLPEELAPPSTTEGWTAGSELLFWQGRLNTSPNHAPHLLDALSADLADVSLEVVADTIYAASFNEDTTVKAAIQQIQPVALERFQREATVPCLQDDGTAVCAHFIFDTTLWADAESESLNSARTVPKNVVHEETMWRVNLVRRLLPGRDEYGTQGYGHHLGVFKQPHDESHKAVKSQYLPPIWATRLNSYYHQLADFADRPSTWEEHAGIVIEARQAIVQNLDAWVKAFSVHYRKKSGTVLIGEHGLLDMSGWDEARKKAEERPPLPQVAVDEWGFVSEGTATSPQKSKGEPTEMSSRFLSGPLNLIRHRKYLEASRNYFSAIANFLRQAPSVFAFLPHADKFVTPEQMLIKQGILEENHLSERDLDPHLPTYNFAEAHEALRPFQREFRKQLGHLTNATRLAQLEQQEQKTLELAWSTWIFFANNPARRGLPSPEREALATWKDATNKVRRKMKQATKELQSSGINIVLTKSSVAWEDQPALWLTLDIDSSGHLYDNYEIVLEKLKTGLPSMEPNSVQYYAAKLSWPTIHVIPILKGKALSMASWQLNTDVLMGSEVKELGWWNRVPRPIPDDTRKELGLEVWPQERMKWWVEMQAHFARLYQLIGHTASLLPMPDPNEIGTEVLENYAQSMSLQASKTFQGFVDGAAGILDYVNGLPDGQLAQRPDLIAAVQRITEVHAELAERGLLGSQQKWSLTDLAALQEPYFQMAALLEFGRLSWAADVIAHDSV